MLAVSAAVVMANAVLNGQSAAQDDGDFQYMPKTGFSRHRGRSISVEQIKSFVTVAFPKMFNALDLMAYISVFVLSEQGFFFLFSRNSLNLEPPETLRLEAENQHGNIGRLQTKRGR